MTNIPPIQIRKIKNATHEDIEYANVKANDRAIIRIIRPIDRGFVANNIENVNIVITKVINNKIIYNYKNYTYSNIFKGYCALYTNL